MDYETMELIMEAERTVQRVTDNLLIDLVVALCLLGVMIISFRFAFGHRRRERIFREKF